MTSTKNLLARSGVLMGTAAAALAATAALGAGTASAAAAPAASASASVHANIAIRPNTIIFGNCGEWFHTTTYANIRNGAGTNHSIIGVMKPGEEFAASIETSYEYNGYHWLEGYDVQTGQSGWIARGSWIVDEGPAYCTVLS